MEFCLLTRLWYATVLTPTTCTRSDLFPHMLGLMRTHGPLVLEADSNRALALNNESLSTNSTRALAYRDTGVPRTRREPVCGGIPRFHFQGSFFILLWWIREKKRDKVGDFLTRHFIEQFLRHHRNRRRDLLVHVRTT